ncbi:exo-beta-N-acetylmuramidase NamZ domain-containing protein [Paenibacillus caui]|uniref:exo-beta-N-acetylmuramidase NamZ family protein n=1 Tax=Paenibacillus caui TaxID=2873927 RepID=UPI001CA93A4F|nr:DUF1343 domain-containing protein [Paenibacillus caui]
MKCKVKTGADRLAALDHPMIRGRRLGLVTNPTGITADFASVIDIASGLKQAELTALFACEHGLYGQRQAGEKFGDETHPSLGIPVYSLYGEYKKPTAAMLESVDTILFDMQDLGVRFYTYLSTLIYVMEACAEHGKSLLVLDRPNPLGGNVCEGGILQPGFESMVGAWSMPIRTGLTIGELALAVNGERRLGCDLDVVLMEGWNRKMEFIDTGLPWMMPSPNIPTIDSVRVYAGTCLFEGTNVSEGRGTTRPFEWIGAPWIDGADLAAAMNKRRQPGVHFHPVYITPTFSKHQGELCGGVRLFVTQPDLYQSVRTGLALLHEIASGYPERFEWLSPPPGGRRHFIDLLAGGEDVRARIADEEGLEAVLEAWDLDEERWRQIRKSYLLYER